MRMAACLAVLAAAAATDPAARADQDVYFPGKTLVPVSASDLNVLVAERGRIEGAVANEDDLSLTHRGGRLFFRLVSGEKAVPLFVEVARDGREPELYTLLLDPVAGLSAERIVIRDRDVPGAGGAAARPAALRLREIKELAIAMARGWELDGYSIDRSPGPVRASLGDGARVVRTAAYRGDSLVGETWTVANTGEGELALGEEDLAAPGVVAVAVEGAPVAPGGSAGVIVIRHAREGR